MSTFYESPNDYRNYLCHYGVKGMKWRKGRKTLRDHRIEQVRKTINSEELTGEHENRIRQRETERRNNEGHHEADTEQARRSQIENNINAVREEKIRRERQIQDERDRNRKRNIEPTGLSELKEFGRARINKHKLQKIYNTRVSGSRRR